jgi:hypothetical protein
MFEFCDEAVYEITAFFDYVNTHQSLFTNKQIIRTALRSPTHFEYTVAAGDSELTLTMSISELNDLVLATKSK